MRRLLPLTAAAVLSSCIQVNPKATARISPETINSGRRPAMVQTTRAGSIQVDSVVYKPKYLPLGTFLKRLSRGDIKSARRMAPFKYKRSNVDDRALKDLIKHGLIPVFVSARNVGDKPVDLQYLRLLLKDTALTLAPIPNDELPAELKSLSPKALAADAYNAAVVVASSIVILAAAAALDSLNDKLEHKSSNANEEGAKNFLAEQLDEKLLPDAAAKQAVEVTVDPDNPIFNRLTKTTAIDYNGLLFTPRALDPGQSAKGLLFFKARGVDWSALNLQAFLPR